jgi:hypothetical protein
VRDAASGAAGGGLFLEESRKAFRSIKRLAEKAMAQVPDARFFAALDPDSNSIAVLVKHVSGNLRSRWTDFLTSDGEKPDRRRDSEFEIAPEDSRENLIARWESGWSVLFGALDALQPGDLVREILIRGEAHTVVRAIQRQLTHYAEHAGQIVLLARHWAGPEWKTLSIPRGASEQFNRDKGADRP